MRALSVVVLLDAILVLGGSSLLAIIATGNLGYFLAHIAALAGVLTGSLGTAAQQSAPTSP